MNDTGYATIVPKDKTRDHFAALTARPVSVVARDLCDSLCVEIMTATGEKALASRKAAFAALVADLIEGNPNDPDGWLYRSLRSNTFNGGEVGYRPFSHVYRAAQAQGLIEVLPGTPRFAPSIATGAWIAVQGTAHRFRATEALRRRFADKGIARETWGQHFARSGIQRTLSASSVELRASSGRYMGEKHKGRLMPLSKDDPRLPAIVERMERINSYLSGQAFTPLGPVRLVRKFNEGDAEGFAWNKGGRLYGPHSRMKKGTERTLITINDEPTVELDFRASHLTILVGLGHVPGFVLGDADPYTVEGIPRPVVKQWVTMTLSHGRRHARWPAVAVAELRKQGIDLSKDFPLKRTGDAILKVLPILSEDSEGSAVGMGWADLQFIESEIVLSAMETLAFDHDVPSLPVHDSLIVPVQAKETAKRVLGESFKRAVGVVPVID